MLVVDDEPVARDGLARMVATLRLGRIVGTAGNARDGLTRCLELRPDVMLLDVEMPVDDGLALLRALSPADLPYVVLVTAFEQYAISAFRHGVNDYVLKPVHAQRLKDVFERATLAIEDRGMAALGRQVRSLAASGGEISIPRAASGNLVVRDIGRTRVVPLDSIEWIQAEGYYARLHSGTRSYLLRESLDSLAGRLPEIFMRVHRSSIVRLDCVVEVRTRREHGVAARLNTGQEVEVSRRRVAALRAAVLRRGAIAGRSSA